MAPDTEIQRVAGLRTIRYLEFQRKIIRLLFYMSVIGLTVVLPVNSRGTSCSETSGIDNGAAPLENEQGDSLCKWSSKNLAVGRTPLL